tara:strand:+ start:253 stop:480 length:228 start_codon:yes stop_codon:yes gene_type:complete
LVDNFIHYFILSEIIFFANIEYKIIIKTSGDKKYNTKFAVENPEYFKRISAEIKIIKAKIKIIYFLRKLFFFSFL